MRNHRKRILLLGASSYIGKYFWKRLGPTQARGTYASHSFAGGIQFDVQKDSLASVVKDIRSFSHAIVLLGETQFDRCAEDRRRSNAINVYSIKRLIDTLIACDIHITFASSNYVFDGTRGNYRETDVPTPTLTYGKQKYCIEQYLSRKTDNYLITRFSKVYGTNPGDGTLFTAWIEQLLTQQSIAVAFDHVFSPIWIEDLVTVVLRLIKERAIGIYHIAGPRGISRKALFEMTLEKLNRKKSLVPRVTYCSIDDFPLVEKRPHNVTLSIEKLISAAGITPQSPEELCSKIIENYSI